MKLVGSAVVFYCCLNDGYKSAPRLICKLTNFCKFLEENNNEEIYFIIFNYTYVFTNFKITRSISCNASNGNEI
ncbi:MAG: hypothetical protein A2X63_00990 [Ignavibacteria bacterium GWA2_35_8]|nr:MAG: hypothetical protein A2X63_00990 [Ignavibacteria bacterium GWA2_35_8]